MTCVGDLPFHLLTAFTGLLVSWPTTASPPHSMTAGHLKVSACLLNEMLVKCMIASYINWFFLKLLVAIAKFKSKWTDEAFRKCKKKKKSGKMKAFISTLPLQLLLMGWIRWWVWYDGYEQFGHFLSFFFFFLLWTRKTGNRQFLCSLTVEE